MAEAGSGMGGPKAALIGLKGFSYAREGFQIQSRRFLGRELERTGRPVALTDQCEARRYFVRFLNRDLETPK